MEEIHFASHGRNPAAGVLFKMGREKTTMSLSNTKMMHPGHTVRDEAANEGIVYKKTIGNYLVHAGERVVSCTLSSRLRKDLEYPTAGASSLRHAVKKVREIEHVDPIAIGDRVKFIETAGSQGMIVEVLPRRNRLSRKTAVPMPGAHAFEQVIVANIDQVVPVFAAANPTPKWNMLDRYLVAAESFNLSALICITKLDLAQDHAGTIDEELQQEAEEFRRIGYPVVLASAATGQGLEELKQMLHGRVSVFVGKSGVGKSTLLNALQPGLGLKVKEVSQLTGKGRHTTSHLEMFSVDFYPDGGGAGSAIVDTPGTREFGLWDIFEDDLALFFPEIRPYIGQCRFGLNCRHDEETGCAVRKAVTSGKISPRRYQSYMRMKET
jgi:ribosome biogenesis GTPase